MTESSIQVTTAAESASAETVTVSRETTSLGTDTISGVITDTPVATPTVDGAQSTGTASDATVATVNGVVARGKTTDALDIITPAINEIANHHG